MSEMLYTPPKPNSLPSVVALIRALWIGDGNLLGLLPAAAYHFDIGHLGSSRRGTVLFNDPVAVKEIMRDEKGIFPKSDLMVGALDPLIGESMFVTDGPKWRRQRAMIDPAFSLMRLNIAYAAMCEKKRQQFSQKTDSKTALDGDFRIPSWFAILQVALTEAFRQPLQHFNRPVAEQRVAKCFFERYRIFASHPVRSC